MFRQRIALFLLLLAPATAMADVVEYNTEDRDQWFTDVNALGEIATIDFIGFANNTSISDQYDTLGVRFDGLNFITLDVPSFNDEWGLRIFNGNDLFFDEPINWIAADFIGTMSIDLYSGDTFIDSIHVGNSGLGQFGGAISTQAFDRVFIYDLGDKLTVLDDLFFGPPISVPAPGAIALLGLLVFAQYRRR